tara:strand:+ start:797 stop:1309 length:513 start_codon:yes stop_codon:yes gene_type:complete
MVTKLTDLMGEIEQKRNSAQPVETQPKINESDKLKQYIDRGEKVAEVRNEIHNVLDTKTPVVEQEKKEEKILVDNVSVKDKELLPEISYETKLILEAFERLIDRIEKLEAPTIHLPPSEIIIQMPEQKRSVSKIIERDEEGHISAVHETTIEVPTGEPLIESRDKKKTRK